MRSADTEHATEQTHTETDKRNDAEQQEQRITGDRNTMLYHYRATGINYHIADHQPNPKTQNTR